MWHKNVPTSIYHLPWLVLLQYDILMWDSNNAHFSRSLVDYTQCHIKPHMFFIELSWFRKDIFQLSLPCILSWNSWSDTFLVIWHLSSITWLSEIADTVRYAEWDVQFYPVIDLIVDLQWVIIRTVPISGARFWCLHDMMSGDHLWKTNIYILTMQYSSLSESSKVECSY